MEKSFLKSLWLGVNMGEEDRKYNNSIRPIACIEMRLPIEAIYFIHNLMSEEHPAFYEHHKAALAAISGTDTVI